MAAICFHSFPNEPHGCRLPLSTTINTYQDLFANNKGFLLLLPFAFVFGTKFYRFIANESGFHVRNIQYDWIHYYWLSRFEWISLPFANGVILTQISIATGLWGRICTWWISFCTFRNCCSTFCCYHLLTHLRTEHYLLLWWVTLPFPLSPSKYSLNLNIWKRWYQWLPRLSITGEIMLM